MNDLFEKYNHLLPTLTRHQVEELNQYIDEDDWLSAHFLLRFLDNKIAKKYMDIVR